MYNETDLNIWKDRLKDCKRYGDLKGVRDCLIKIVAIKKELHLKEVK